MKFDKDNYPLPDEWMNHIGTHQLPDGTYKLCGQVFQLQEITLAFDFYCMCHCSGIFNYDKVELGEFLNYDMVLQNIGAKIVLALFLHPDVVGAFMMGEDDGRVIQMCRKRLQNEEYGLEGDSELEIAFK